MVEMRKSLEIANTNKQERKDKEIIIKIHYHLCTSRITEKKINYFQQATKKSKNYILLCVSTRRISCSDQKSRKSKGKAVTKRTKTKIFSKKSEKVLNYVYVYY